MVSTQQPRRHNARVGPHFLDPRRAFAVIGMALMARCVGPSTNASWSYKQSRLALVAPCGVDWRFEGART